MKTGRQIYFSLALLLLGMAIVMVVTGCGNADEAAVDRENEQAYYFHYRDLDSTLVYARRAAKLASGYGDGQAEALNNLAFVSLMKMDYEKAGRQLDSVAAITDNQVELLIADIQHMRLCQRQSRNRDFYGYHESARRRLRRIEEESNLLSEHQQRRLNYARSEMAIVTSAYFYYVGLTEPSVKEL